jgi:hypothetical protein
MSKMPTGLPSLDRALGGGLSSDGVTLIAAPPKVFLTTLLVYLMKAWSRQGDRVYFITTEDSRFHVMARLKALAGGDDPSLIHIVSIPDDLPLRPLEMLQGPAPSILIVDSLEGLGALLSDSSGPEVAMRALKAYAIHRQVPVLMGCSLSRQSKDLLNNQDAAPAQLAEVTKHAAYPEYAASAMLVLERHPDQQPYSFTVKLHVAQTRQGLECTTMLLTLFADGLILETAP